MYESLKGELGMHSACIPEESTPMTGQLVDIKAVTEAPQREIGSQLCVCVGTAPRGPQTTPEGEI